MYCVKIIRCLAVTMVREVGGGGGGVLVALTPSDLHVSAVTSMLQKILLLLSARKILMDVRAGCHM